MQRHGVTVCVVFICNCFPKMKDFSKLGTLQAVTYTVKVEVARKWCKIDTLFLHTSNRKYLMVYRLLPMTLNDFEGSSPVAVLIKCNSTDINARDMLAS